MVLKKRKTRLFSKSIEQKFECLELKFDEVNNKIDKVESSSHMMWNSQGSMRPYTQWGYFAKDCSNSYSNNHKIKIFALYL